MKNAPMILELIGDLMRARNHAREALAKLQRDLTTLQIERDELRVKLRRLEAERAGEKAT